MQDWSQLKSPELYQYSDDSFLAKGIYNPLNFMQVAFADPFILSMLFYGLSKLQLMKTKPK